MENLIILKVMMNIVFGWAMAFLIVVFLRELYLFLVDNIQFYTVKYIYKYIGKAKESKKAKKNYSLLKFRNLVINNYIKN